MVTGDGRRNGTWTFDEQEGYLPVPAPRAIRGASRSRTARPGSNQRDGALDPVPALALVRQVASATGPADQDRNNAALIARLRVSAEGQEGIGAFLEKRAPAWAPGE